MAVLALAAPARPASAQTASTTEASTADWVQVAAGGNHSCGIRTSGRLYCWGDDAYGQLGNGPGSTTDRLAPVEVAGNATNWASVAAGGDHTCAIKTSGKLFCWGADTYGQVGDDTAPTNRDVPVAVFNRSVTPALWTAVDLGESHTCAIRSTKRLFCWGLNGNGQVGNDDPNIDRAVPTQVVTAFSDWVTVTAGGFHSCAIRMFGDMYCWGRGVDGELGDFHGVDAAKPSRVYVASGHADPWKSVTAGAFHTCAVTVDRHLACWGSDSDGQQGNGGAVTDNQLKPRFFTAPTEASWASVTAGDFHTCAKKTSPGRLYCWGDDSAGQIGNGVPYAEQPRPTEVAGGSTGWTQAATGRFHSCALRSSGRLFCWGSDESGAVGDAGIPEDRPTPTQVA